MVGCLAGKVKGSRAFDDMWSQRATVMLGSMVSYELVPSYFKSFSFLDTFLLILWMRFRPNPIVFLEKGSRIQAQVLRSLFAYRYNSSGFHFHSTSFGVIWNHVEKCVIIHLRMLKILKFKNCEWISECGLKRCDFSDTLHCLQWPLL